ncbi:MAG: TetR/AcrR family transcriptional regulator [Sphingopyxis sp.]|nr:TetR/AcrR family transcriptional regulator [Sphingopyxis sp.]
MAERQKRRTIRKRKLKPAAELPEVMQGPRSETRQRMLTATLNYLRAHGIADLSLRQLADQLGTSHRLLSYHFGTKEGLLVAVVEEIERENRLWAQSLAERKMSPMEVFRLSWERTCDPALDGALRLFVEVYGHALQGRAHTAPLLDTLVHDWQATISARFEQMGMTPASARVHGRLYIATLRGLMLDLLTTRDLETTTAAWHEYISQYEDLPGAHDSDAAEIPA